MAVFRTTRTAHTRNICQILPMAQGIHVIWTRMACRTGLYVPFLMNEEGLSTDRTAQKTTVDAGRPCRPPSPSRAKNDTNLAAPMPIDASRAKNTVACVLQEELRREKSIGAVHHMRTTIMPALTATQACSAALAAITYPHRHVPHAPTCV